MIGVRDVCLTLLSALFLRLLYVAADTLSAVRGWTEARKRRVFVVRIVSFSHALLTGGGSLLSLYLYPQLLHDPFGYTCDYVRLLACFSMGYFIHDISDMIIYGEGPTSKEYITHHSLALGGFLGILHTDCLFGVAMIGLLAEVHTIFLHIRTMLRLNGSNRENSDPYCYVMWANFAALFVFRHVATMWLLLYLGFWAKQAPFLLRLFLLAGTTFLFYHNCHLQYRLMKTDNYLKKLTKKQQAVESERDPLAEDSDDAVFDVVPSVGAEQKMQ